MTGIAEVYRRSLDRPEEFWAEAAEAIDWERRWDRVLDDTRPPFYRWFAGARLNTCWNALDRHVAAGWGERVALIYDSPVTDTVASFTYRQLRDRVARFAGALRSLGVEKGDRVLIYMPMVPEAAIAMLACARIGAIHSVVFGGFAAHELATRIDDAKPKVIVSASCGVEVNRVIPYKPLLDAAIEEAGAKPTACVVLQRPMCRAELLPGRDKDWTRAGGRGAARRLRAGAGDRPALHPLHLRHHRDPERRGARQWRLCGALSPGRCATSTGFSRMRCSGPRVMSAGWSATRTSFMRH